MDIRCEIVLSCYPLPRESQGLNTGTVKLTNLDQDEAN